MAVDFWFDAITKAYQDQRWTEFSKNYNLDSCGDWDEAALLDKLLPEIESTHALLKETGLAIN